MWVNIPYIDDMGIYPKQLGAAQSVALPKSLKTFQVHLRVGRLLA